MPRVIALSIMTICTAFLSSVVGVLGVVNASAFAAPTDMQTIVTACATQALSSLLVAFVCLTLPSFGSAAGALRHALAR
jgi:hypothetical protein